MDEPMQVSIISKAGRGESDNLSDHGIINIYN